MLAGWVLATAAAGTPLPEARLDRDAPPTGPELESDARLDDRACPAGLGVVPIGLGRFCARRPVEGAALVAWFAEDLALATALPEDSAAGRAGLAGLTKLATTSVGLDVLDGWRHHHRPYTPPEDLGDLALAPFRPEVLRRPGVWAVGGIATAAATTVVVLTAPEGDLGGRPNLFGTSVPGGVGLPLGVGLEAQLSLKVAMGEEVLFRGMLQGAAARAFGETPGLITSSLVFWAFHVPNWTAGQPREDWARNIALGSAFVGTMGVVLGSVYQAYDYRLSHPVAIHFWYDFVLLSTDFLMDPEHGDFTARITLPF